MAIRKIIEVGNEKLRKISKPVEHFDLRLRLLVKDMADTMYRADGVGLAAPQVGILRRVVVIDCSEDRNDLLVLVNPEIMETEGEQTGGEGCLSIPEQHGIVTRPYKVTVRAQNVAGEWFRKTGEGLLARAMCHEIDHLNGILFIDKTEPETPEENKENEE